MRRLRDDFRTLNWIEIWNNLKYSKRSLEYLLSRPYLENNKL